MPIIIPGDDYEIQGTLIAQLLDFKAPTELTIDTGEITVTQSFHTVDTESDDDSDDLVTINGGSDGRVIVIKPEHTDRTVVVKHNTGNIWLQGKADVTLDDISDGLMLVYSATDSKWFDIAAGGGGLSADSVDKTHLSQDFGASACRLYNLVVSPVSGELLRLSNLGTSCFVGKINGAPTATSVVYDTDTNENMLNGLSAYDGSAFWGQIILHNTTRANSRKVVSVNVATNTITTTSSTDDWANNDDITAESQTNAGDGTLEFFDVDISDNVGTGVHSVLLQILFQDNENNFDANRSLYFHPYQAYNVGKTAWIRAKVAMEANCGMILVPVVSQKITLSFAAGCVDCYLRCLVAGKLEYADT